jgi:hypothetical protein
MTLIVEDGTGMDTAQSAVSAAQLRAWAELRGITVPSNDPAGDTLIEQALVDAMDYLQVDICYRGELVNENQGIPFPRKCFVYENGSTLGDSVVPNNFKTAQIRLALEVLKGTVLMPTLSGNASDYVIKDKVGPIETEYADPTKFSGKPTFTAVEALLASLIGGDCCPAVGFTFGVYRG